MFNIIWRLPIFIFIWLVYFFLIKLPVNGLGLFVIPFMWEYRDVDYDKLPWWTRLWSNLEDWQGQINSYQSSLPRWWVVAHGTKFWSFYRYHAIRNGGDGLRSIEWFDLDIDKDKVKYWTPRYFQLYEPITARAHEKKTIGYIAWQGWQAGMKIVHIWHDKRHFVIKLGWRVEPSDKVNPLGPTELSDDASFASKFLPYRKG